MTQLPAMGSKRIRRGSAMANILACLALLISIAALVIVIVQNPMGSALSKYDFSTPEKAYRSGLVMERDRDLNARLEYEARIEGKRIREKIDTLKIHDTVDWQDKKLLFVSFEEDGELEHEVRGFEKHEDSGFWKYTYVSDYRVEKDDKALAERIRRWKRSGKSAENGAEKTAEDGAE